MPVSVNFWRAKRWIVFIVTGLKKLAISTLLLDAPLERPEAALSGRWRAYICNGLTLGLAAERLLLKRHCLDIFALSALLSLVCGPTLLLSLH